MSSNRFAVVAVLVLAFSAVFVAREVRAKETKTPYSHMAPVEEYLMTDRNAEIALARTAAPDSIAHDATVLVLGMHGYETAVEGKNGFVCVVERAWMSPSDSPQFGIPKLRRVGRGHPRSLHNANKTVLTFDRCLVAVHS